MKNALRFTVLILATISMMACQKNADKIGTSVRSGSRTVGANGMPSTTSNSVATMSTPGQVSNGSASEVANLVYPQVGTLIGSINSVNVGLAMCGLPALSASQTPLTNTKARIEVDVVDSYVSQYGLQPIKTSLSFLQGYLQTNGQGNTTIAAEFGDGSGNIAISGSIDSQGNLTAYLYNNTFARESALGYVGTFTLPASSGWYQNCSQ